MPKPRREGYLLIDHRESPGIDPELAHRVAQQTGLPCPAVGKNKLMECATLTCCHCNVVVILRPDRKRARGYCARCDHYVCDRPACNLDCKNFEKMLEYVQEAYGKAEDCGEVITGDVDLNKLYTTLSLPVGAVVPRDNK